MPFWPSGRRLTATKLVYTLGDVLPVLAIVEDTSHVRYGSLQLEETGGDAFGLGKGDAAAVEAEEMGGPAAAAPVTSSIRAALRLLYAIGGWRSLFRGFLPFAVLHAANVAVQLALGLVPFVPGLVAELLPPLLTVQLHTAWTHIVISGPSAVPFWRRVPAFGATFRATALPAAVFLLAAALSRHAPLLLFGLAGVAPPRNPFVLALPLRLALAADDVVKLLALMALSLAAVALLVTPAHAVLTRIQASILTDADRAVVPFDRAFGVPGHAGRGYLSLRDAWQCFTREAWVRLVKLYVKIFLVSTAVYVLAIAVAGLTLTLF